MRHTTTPIQRPTLEEPQKKKGRKKKQGGRRKAGINLRKFRHIEHAIRACNSKRQLRSGRPCFIKRCGHHVLINV
jgi:hypothetical protein